MVRSMFRFDNADKRPWTDVLSGDVAGEVDEVSVSVAGEDLGGI